MLHGRVLLAPVVVTGASQAVCKFRAGKVISFAFKALGVFPGLPAAWGVKPPDSLRRPVCRVRSVGMATPETGAMRIG